MQRTEMPAWEACAFQSIERQDQLLFTLPWAKAERSKSDEKMPNFFF